VNTTNIAKFQISLYASDKCTWLYQNKKTEILVLYIIYIAFLAALKINRHMTHSNVCLFLVATSVKSSAQTAKNRSQAKKVEQNLNYEADILPKTNHNADINLEMIPESVQAVQKISSLLATDLKKEQSETEKYERFLENALIGGEVNDTDIPDISCLPPWSVFDSSDQSIPGDHVLVEGFSQPLVTDELDRFKRELDTNRRESDLYENQLRKWLGSPV
jgi:hypothetical protein